MNLRSETPKIKYSTDNFYQKGIEQKNTIKDKNGKIYTATTNTYVEKDIGVERSYFVQLKETKTDYYDGAGVPQITGVQAYDYDEYGNVIRFTDRGDVIDSSDDITAEIIYEYRPTQYLMALPVKITVIDGQGTVLRQRTGAFDTLGRLRSITQVSGNTSSTTTMDYYDDGNLKMVVYPPNDRSQRYSLTYTYDSSVQTYITQVKDVFGLTSSSLYDIKYGLPLVTTDTNRNTMYYYYDTYGRTERIAGPYDAGSYTISFNYDIAITPF